MFKIKFIGYLAVLSPTCHLFDIYKFIYFLQTHCSCMGNKKLNQEDNSATNIVHLVDTDVDHNIFSKLKYFHFDKSSKFNDCNNLQLTKGDEKIFLSFFDPEFNFDDVMEFFRNNKVSCKKRIVLRVIHSKNKKYIEKTISYGAESWEEYKKLVQTKGRIHWIENIFEKRAWG